MSNQLAVIEQKLTSPDTTNRLLALMGISADNERGQQEVFRFASSVLAEIKKSTSDPKKDLSSCQPDSIVQAMIDAASFGLTIDGRQHAHLVKYGNSAVFQIGYRGYLAKIKEHYPDADFTVELIFDGDTLKIWTDESGQRFTLDKPDPFNQVVQKFKGVLFAVRYTENGRLISKAVAIPKERIDRARKAAKQDFIWNTDYFEKAKAAAIKSACKYHFAALQGLQEMLRYDNENNYDLNKTAEPTRSSIIDNINRSVAPEPLPQSEPEPDYIDAEVVEEIVDHEIDALISAGDESSSLGVETYKAWLATLSDEQKSKIKDKHAQWSAAAKKADAESEFPL